MVSGPSREVRWRDVFGWLLEALGGAGLVVERTDELARVAAPAVTTGDDGAPDAEVVRPIRTTSAAAGAVERADVSEQTPTAAPAVAARPPIMLLTLRAA